MLLRRARRTGFAFALVSGLLVSPRLASLPTWLENYAEWRETRGSALHMSVAPRRACNV